MIPERSFSRITLLLVGVTMALGLTACGSNDSSESATTDAGVQSTGGQNGNQSQIKPDRKAPDSAGDRKDAPDDVISQRPGGPVAPVKP
ncbi:MAG: hypothetical protein QG596_372 [Actinomycetota bacterium]|jgi:hypothetical protein|nr:hypothetical protein [Actinomycetota bacterium]